MHYTNHSNIGLPIGLVSKNSMGDLNILINILLCSTLDALMANIKNVNVLNVEVITVDPTSPPNIPNLLFSLKAHVEPVAFTEQSALNQVHSTSKKININFHHANCPNG